MTDRSKISRSVKIRICYIALTLLAAISLYGCDKKKDDASFIIDALEESEGEIGYTKLARELNIPQSINHQLETDISGLDSILISDDDIEVPNVSDMYTFECNRAELNEAYRQTVAESIFGSSILYVYDGTVTKADCEYYIDYYERMEEGPVAFYHEMYTELAEEYKEKLKNAPESREKNMDFSANQYIGTIEGQQYLLTFRADGDDVASVELELYPDISLGDFIHADKGIEVSCLGLSKEDFYSYKNLDYDELITEANECTYDIDKAMEIASGYMNSIMAFDLSLIYAEDLGFSFSDYTNDTTFKMDGYNMAYVPEIEGVLQYTSDLYYVDYLQKENEKELSIYDEDDETVMTNGSIMQIAVSSAGIIGMDCYMPLEKTSAIKKADLLTWNEIVASLETALPDYYTKHKTAYSQINFNSVALSYYPKETGTGYRYTPVWVFSEVDKEIDEPVQIVIIDAQDGTVVEVK